MPSPFPGMDPYLERPSLWPGLHTNAISEIQGILNPRVRPNYIVQIETRVYIEQEDDPALSQMVADVSVERPPSTGRRKGVASASVLQVAEPVLVPYMLDPEIQEPYLEIRDRPANTLVTVIEVLSPSNKVRNSAGRESFLAKRREILSSSVNWVEIDLLRGGQPSLTKRIPESDYRVLVSRFGDRRITRCWPIHLRQKLPAIGIPLKEGDEDVGLDLAVVLSAIYDRARYEDLIDYTEPPDPPLNSDDAKWANKLLRAKGLR